MMHERANGHSVDLERARALVLAHGWNTTSYQILNPGFQYWFSPSADAVVGHVRRKRIWVVGGAPVCAPDRLDEALIRFEGEAHAAGAGVCYVGAQDRLARRCLPHPGYAATVLGTEPWWDPGAWPALVAQRQSLRAQLNRARNKGVTATVRPAGAGAEPALDPLLRAWLASKGLPPLGFLTTPWLLDDLRDRRLVVAEQHGAPVGYLVLTPIPDRGGWLVEQIVRGPSAPNGTAELLVDAAFQWMAGCGARYATLGLAPLTVVAGAPPPRDPWWLAWSLRWLRAHGRRFYNFEGLQRFKAKLGPAGWDPVYAIADESRISLRTMLGVSEAVVGGDLVRFGAKFLFHALSTEMHRMTTGAR
jgi:phosphatidylglycerol lysyltransferase